MIRTKRVYLPAAHADGRRYLVDRLWPRGIARDELAIDDWLKELGPSHELRKWFAHTPERWEAFKARYAEELAGKEELWRPLLAESKHGTVTLLYSARDEKHNQAMALSQFLSGRMKRSSATRKK